LGAQLRSTVINPIDYCYHSLGIELRPLESTSETFKLISKYAAAGDSREPIYNVFALRRKGESERFAPFETMANRQLLWHGSSISNFSGILSQGLRIAPPEADISGAMFGRGLYFADQFEKSLAYCRPLDTIDWGNRYHYYNPWTNAANRRSRDPTEVTANKFKLLLLCEVALGKTANLVQSKLELEAPEPGTNSTRGIGSHSPDPSLSLTFPDGLVVPCGPIIPTPPPPGFDPKTFAPGLSHNEYIVYNEAQVKMRYLVQVGAQDEHDD